MQQIVAKVARNTPAKSEMFLISRHFAKELEFIITDFGSEMNAQLKELIAKFIDVSLEPQGLPPHRGIFDNRIIE